ncbi:hypothetical protein G5B40_04565 [Pikeienuella piscinae]|uniref:Phosphodiester glycosidase domain-containing protein n=1 Tax=Pikeienuella piscinae TaxID=2748098 RepID=A0A7L5BVE4_9RHOB|nr:hypothetical protein [Pikeienuella piscinae]QIE54778.1 hypothetical protein G5B40_04565 [Pikeienuella piscinae]
MIRCLASFALGALLATPLGAAELCERSDPTLLWTACDGRAHVELLLLPEDAGLTPEYALDVTGGYTAADKREDEKPKPVGLFVRRGEIVLREYVRFDGVLLIDETGAPRILHRRRADFGDETFDLDDPGRRAAFLEAVAAGKGSLLQSHLLIADGEIDAFEKEGAPRFRRRILFQTAAGETAIFDSGLRALTLAEATAEVAAEYAPRMAINLDMGSYDFCQLGKRKCGLLSYAETGKLSNILRFSVK